MDVLSDGNSAFVNISDEGRGIAPDDLENVKVKFFKGKGAVRGSGIGLAVVDEHDGDRAPASVQAAGSVRRAAPRRHGGGLKRFPGVAGLPARRETLSGLWAGSG